MKLNLISAMHYRPSEKTLDGLLAGIDAEERGYDAFIGYSLSFSGDSLSIIQVESGEKAPYSEEERSLIEQGTDIGARDGETISIPAGTYEFMQLPAVFTQSDLPRLLLPYATHARKAYVRIFKENILETVMQFLISC